MIILFILPSIFSLVELMQTFVLSGKPFHMSVNCGTIHPVNSKQLSQFHFPVKNNNFLLSNKCQLLFLLRFINRHKKFYDGFFQLHWVLMKQKFFFLGNEIENAIQKQKRNYKILFSSHQYHWNH